MTEMTTKLEEQDESYRKIGFHPEKDFSYPQLSKEECQLFLNIRDIAKESEEDNKLVALLSQCKITYDIEKIYRYSDKSGFRQFVARLQASSPLPLPNSVIFDKLDLCIIVDSFIDWIAIDGGEIRQDKAYKEDGNTLKEGWIRLYWK
jgi:hypothetical protein